jgi:uncharacterized protein (TIGR03083 family)
LEPTRWIELISARATALRDAVATDFQTVVPTCPGWTMGDLLGHTAGAWSWATMVVRSGQREPQPDPPIDLGPDGLIDWAQSRLEDLVDALRSADPASNCWTFGLPRTRTFWYRRAALETTVHAWDAQAALGMTDPIADDVALEGIEEFITTMLGRCLRSASAAWDGQSLHLHRTDGEGEWLLRLGPDGVLEATTDHGKADVALRGTASSLYLWCMNRISSSELEVFGDATIVDLWKSTITL